MAYLKLDNHVLQFCPTDIAYYRNEIGSVTKVRIVECMLTCNKYGFDEFYSVVTVPQDKDILATRMEKVPQDQLFNTPMEAFQ